MNKILIGNIKKKSIRDITSFKKKIDINKNQNNLMDIKYITIVKISSSELFQHKLTDILHSQSFDPQQKDKQIYLQNLSNILMKRQNLKHQNFNKPIFISYLRDIILKKIDLINHASIIKRAGLYQKYLNSIVYRKGLQSNAVFLFDFLNQLNEKIETKMLTQLNHGFELNEIIQVKKFIQKVLNFKKYLKKLRLEPEDNQYSIQKEIYQLLNQLSQWGLYKSQSKRKI